MVDLISAVFSGIFNLATGLIDFLFSIVSGSPTKTKRVEPKQQSYFEKKEEEKRLKEGQKQESMKEFEDFVEFLEDIEDE